MINRVILVGNLTKDADGVNTAGKAMTRMRVATNSQWRDADGNRQEASEFHTVVAFARLAEVCALYCTRGKRVYIEGRLRTREFDGADGTRRTATEVVADTVKFLQPREAAGATDSSGSEDASGEEAAPPLVGVGSAGVEI